MRHGPNCSSGQLETIAAFLDRAVIGKILREAGRDAPTQVAELMQQGQVIGIVPPLALAASTHPLPLADSLIR